MKKVLFVLGYLRDEDIDWIIHNGKRKDLTANSVLIRAHEPIAEMFILLSGELSIFSDASSDEIARRYPGEIIGELSFLDSRPPRESVVAATEVSVIAIDRTLLRKKLQEDTPFAARFYQSLGVLLTSRFRQSMGQLNLRDDGDPLEESSYASDEIDPELLDHIALAGHRFEMFLTHFMG